MSDLLPEGVEDLTPSQKLVLLAVRQSDDHISHSDVTEEVLLPSRTVRYSVKELEDQGFITARPKPLDARQTIYEEA